MLHIATSTSGGLVCFYRLIRVVMELLGDRWDGLRGDEEDLAARRSGGDRNPPPLQECLALRQGQVPHRCNEANEKRRQELKTIFLSVRNGEQANRKAENLQQRRRLESR